MHRLIPIVVETKPDRPIQQSEGKEPVDPQTGMNGYRKPVEQKVKRGFIYIYIFL